MQEGEPAVETCGEEQGTNPMERRGELPEPRGPETEQAEARPCGEPLREEKGKLSPKTPNRGRRHRPRLPRGPGRERRRPEGGRCLSWRRGPPGTDLQDGTTTGRLLSPKTIPLPQGPCGSASQRGRSALRTGAGEQEKWRETGRTPISPLKERTGPATCKSPDGRGKTVVELSERRSTL